MAGVADTPNMFHYGGPVHPAFRNQTASVCNYKFVYSHRSTENDCRKYMFPKDCLLQGGKRVYPVA